MFDALLHDRIDTEGIHFETRFADIEVLNTALLEGHGPAVSKASYAIVPYLRGTYRILSAGSALGRGNGPLLVANDPRIDLSDSRLRIAVPGLQTTANLLLERLFPQLKQKTPILFSQIADAVAEGMFDAGVLIHEGRFTYQQKNLSLLVDLGTEWERQTSLPLPLGVILISRQLPEELQQRINRLLMHSIEYGLAHPNASRSFVKSHAQEMEDSVIDRHISLFVNQYSVSLGDEGVLAVSRLLNTSPSSLDIVPHNIFK